MSNFRDEAIADLDKAKEIQPNLISPYFYKFKYIYSDNGKSFGIFKKYIKEKNYYISKLKLNKDSTFYCWVAEDCYFKSYIYKKDNPQKSLVYIDGTEMDFVKEGLNEGFEFNNPNIAGECGCGESFTV